MAGQLTQLVLGDVRAKVSLVKTSAESAGPRWETVRLDVATGRPVIESTATLDDLVTDGPIADLTAGLNAAERDDVGEVRHVTGTVQMRVMTDNAGADHLMAEPAARPPAELGRDLTAPAPIIPQNTQQAAERDAAAGHVPAVRQARGVYTNAGEFIDLTQLLADIDEHVKLDGLTVAKSIDSTVIPRDRVRGSFYIEPAGKKAEAALSTRVRDLLWTVLSEDRRALVVRWTKRTNQALGIVVASRSHGALELLEVEWGPNMRRPSARARVTPGFKATENELAAARDFLKRTAAPTAAIDEIADERRVLQAQAVELAKTKGELLTLPERHSDDEALAAALTA
jgi:hypothetical protein